MKIPPVEDGATVPLCHENRTPELKLVNPDLNEDALPASCLKCG
jgi:hypothetical protein